MRATGTRQPGSRVIPTPRGRRAQAPALRPAFPPRRKFRHCPRSKKLVIVSRAFTEPPAEPGRGPRSSFIVGFAGFSARECGPGTYQKHKDKQREIDHEQG